MRIVFCWSDISGYMVACWKALNAQKDIVLRIYAFGNNDQTNFNMSLTKGLDIHWVDRLPDKRQFANEVVHYLPDIIVLCGWFVPAYRQLTLVKAFANTKMVLAMDTPWRGTWKQQLARIVLSRLIKRMDAVITSGERSYQYARRLGASSIHKIQYGVNVKQLSKNLEARLEKPWPRCFLYVGRFAPEKGINTLVEAYQKYRKFSSQPWELQVCGKGPLSQLLTGEGITNHGFVQPDEMAAIWQSSGCLILPSSFDPWPLIVVEACAAGLPVICTNASGSQVEVVKALWNGLVIPENDTKSLLRSMQWMEKHHEALQEMGQRSHEQAKAYGAEEWAEKIRYLVEEMQ